jgi:hypothetical protein
MRKRTLAAKLADIARNHDSHKPERTLRLNLIAVKRVAVLERYLELRYGRTLPDDDAGREDLVILLNHIAQNPIDPQGKMRRSIHSWAPWMAPDERQELVERIAAKPRRYRAGTLGKRLRLTEEEHEIIGAETVHPFTWSDAYVRERDRATRRERKRAERAAKSSGRPRGRPKKPEGSEQPWVALGIGRATYFRRKARETGSETKNASPYKRDSYTGTELKSHPRDPIEKAGAPKARRPVSGIQVPKSEIVVDKRRRPKAPPPTHLARTRQQPGRTIQ